VAEMFDYDLLSGRLLTALKCVLGDTVHVENSISDNRE
jgi:hypothetical protein